MSIDSTGSQNSNKIQLLFTPTTEPGWYIYSSDNDPNSGPKTEFEFYLNKTYELNGEVMPVKIGRAHV